MGRNYTNQVSIDQSEKNPCGCRKFSWMLYIFVVLALAIAIMNFWMSLSSHEDFRLEMLDLKSEILTLSNRLNTTIDNLQKSNMESDKVFRSVNEKIANLRQEIETLRQRNRQSQRLEQSQQDSVESEEVAHIRAIQKQFGDKIDHLNAKMIGFDITLNNNLVEIDKSQRSIDSLRDIVLQQQQDIDYIFLNNQDHQIPESSLSHRTDLSSRSWNSSLQVLNDTIEKLTLKVHLNTEATRFLKTKVEEMERSTGMLERVNRAEQRLLDLEGNEMKIKSEIKRLNQSVIFKIPEDGQTETNLYHNQFEGHDEAAERSLDYMEDLSDLKIRVSSMEVSTNLLIDNLSSNITSQSLKIMERLDTLENQSSDNRRFSLELEDNLNKINGKIKFLSQNLRPRAQA